MPIEKSTGNTNTGRNWLENTNTSRDQPKNRSRFAVDNQRMLTTTTGTRTNTVAVRHHWQLQRVSTNHHNNDNNYNQLHHHRRFASPLVTTKSWLATFHTTINTLLAMKTQSTATHSQPSAASIDVVDHHKQHHRPHKRQKTSHTKPQENPWQPP